MHLLQEEKLNSLHAAKSHQLTAEQHIVELNIMRLLYNATIQKNCNSEKKIIILLHSDITQLPFPLQKKVQKKTRKQTQA